MFFLFVFRLVRMLVKTKSNVRIIFALKKGMIIPFFTCCLGSDASCVAESEDIRQSVWIGGSARYEPFSFHMFCSNYYWSSGDCLFLGFVFRYFSFPFNPEKSSKIVF